MDVAEEGGSGESDNDNWVVVFRGSLRHGSANDVIDPLNQQSLSLHSDLIVVMKTLTMDQSILDGKIKIKTIIPLKSGGLKAQNLSKTPLIRIHHRT